MAQGFKTWMMKQEGREAPLVEFIVVSHPLNDYLRNWLNPESWGRIEEGYLDWVAHEFVWGETPQGVAFWSAVCDEIQNQSLACEILRSWKYQIENNL